MLSVFRRPPDPAAASAWFAGSSGKALLDSEAACVRAALQQFPRQRSLWLGPAGTGVKVFFLLCVLVAGLYGAATASRKILYIQALPASLGLALLSLG